jgi:hypothetical protein
VAAPVPDDGQRPDSAATDPDPTGTAPPGSTRPEPGPDTPGATPGGASAGGSSGGSGAAASTAGAGPAPDPDDPCAATAACSLVRPGGLIEHDGVRFALGDDGDGLALADSRCHRPPAVALLRPDEGATYFFDRWAEPGHDVPARRGPDVPVGSRWQPQPLGDDGCAALVVLSPDGSPIAVDPTTGPVPEPVEAPGAPHAPATEPTPPPEGGPR